MVISQSDFELWKSEPVTKAFFAAGLDRVEQAKEILSVSAGLNATEDNYLRGFIQAYREIQEFRVEEADGD